MSWFPESKDHLPLTWWRQTPVYLAAIVALAAAASMILTAILGYGVSSHLVFSFEAAFHRLHLWTPLTYVLVNPPSLWVVLGCYLLWSFGEAVERHLGRRSFVRLLLVLLAVSPVMITLLGLAGFSGLACSGVMQLEFGVFLAFATLYPRAKISLLIITIDAWVLAAVLVGVSALSDIAGRNPVALLLLAGNVAAAFGYIRHEQGRWRLPAWPAPVARHQARPSAARVGKRPARPKPRSVQPDVDSILDKISREGMHSLTDEERRILDKASKEMRQRRG